MVPGAPMDDAPVTAGGRPGWLLDQVGGGFKLLVFAPAPSAISPQQWDKLVQLADGPIPIETVVITPQGSDMPNLRVLGDPQGLAAQRYDGAAGAVYLVRPDQHVCARWRRFDAAAVRSALARATCNA